jgi:hypothetical protein
MKPFEVAKCPKHGWHESWQIGLCAVEMIGKHGQPVWCRMEPEEVAQHREGYCPEHGLVDYWTQADQCLRSVGDICGKPCERWREMVVRDMVHSEGLSDRWTPIGEGMEVLVYQSRQEERDWKLFHPIGVVGPDDPWPPVADTGVVPSLLLIVRPKEEPHEAGDSPERPA